VALFIGGLGVEFKALWVHKFAWGEKWHMDVPLTNLRMEFERVLSTRPEGRNTWMYFVIPAASTNKGFCKISKAQPTQLILTPTSVYYYRFYF